MRQDSGEERPSFEMRYVLLHHKTREGVPDSLYKAIQDTDQGTAQGLHWFCKKCNKFASGFMAGLSRLSVRQDAQKKKG